MTATNEVDVQNTRLIFDHELPSDSPEIDDLGNRSNTPVKTEVKTSPSAMQGNVLTPGVPVPRSVKVTPEIPEMKRYSGTSLQIRQLWEGTVIEVRDEVFVAVLNDKTQANNPAEQVEFESVELREDDRPLVSPGSVFYWMIGTERTPSGQVRNVSTIEFSRLPIWTRSSLKTASEKALRTQEWFHANGNRPS